MRQALPFGEIRPGARPVSQFIQPAQTQVAAAARPSLLPQVKGMASLQQAGTSSVTGYNQLAQMAEALGPLNKGLTKAAQRFVVNQASSSIEEGYYEQQALQNQTQQALFNLQQQQEAGSADAATQITALEKSDPAGAALLREANPWKAIGRRRLMAQLAAGDIDNALETDLLNNAGALSTYKPGSPELMRRKAALTQQVLSEYGLTGSEPEAGYYVTPKLNKAWDSYTEKQGKLYTAELRESTIQATSAAMGTRLVEALTNGVELPDGTIISPGSPMFGALGGAILSQALEADLAQLGGKDKADALKRIRDQLIPTFGRMPGGFELLGNIRGGPARDANGKLIPLDKRPRWMDSMPYDLLKGSTEGAEMQSRFFDAQQAQMGVKAREAYQKDLAGLDTRSDEYRLRLEEFRNTFGQWEDIDQYIKTREADQAVVDTATDVEIEGTDAERERLSRLPPQAFLPENREELQMTVDNIVENTPGSREEKRALRRKLWETINEREKFLAKLPTGTEKKINNAVRIALSDPDIMKLDVGKKIQNALAGISGIAPQQAMLGNPQYAAYYNGVTGLMTQTVEAGIADWYADRDKQGAGAIQIPESEVQKIVNESYSKMLTTSEHRQLYEEATGKNFAAPGEKPLVAPPVVVQPREAWADIPDQEARQYNSKPVIDQVGLYKELEALQNNKPVSRDLIKLAEKAGTNVYQFLGKQVELYIDDKGKNTLDPDGSVRRYLQQKSKEAKANGTVAQTLYPSLAGTGLGMITPANPFAPGSWLMRMMGIVGEPQPPAAAAPTQEPRPVTGGTYTAGQVLTQDQIEDVLRQAGWPEEEISLMGAVAFAESTGRTGVVNNNPATGDDSWGMLQVNMIGDIGPYRRQKYGLSSNEDLLDPVTNARVALDIRRSEGIQAWGAYTDGRYKEFLR
jgi:hypothetical protein